MIAVVELTKEERNLYDSISGQRDDMAQNLDKTQPQTVARLAEILLRRRAIPQHRLDYFAKPEMNGGRSRKQAFEDRGTSGRTIFEHPDFLPFLRYFIFGPNLPKTTIEGLFTLIRKDSGKSSLMPEMILTFVRSEVRNKHLPHEAAEEFYKLAFEVGRPELAASVRSAAQQAQSDA